MIPLLLTAAMAAVAAGTERFSAPGGASWQPVGGWKAVPAKTAATADVLWLERAGGPGRLQVGYRADYPLTISSAELANQAESLSRASARIGREAQFTRPPQIIRVAGRRAMEFVYRHAGDEQPEMVRVILMPAGPGSLRFRISAPTDSFDTENREFDRLLDTLRLPDAVPPAAAPADPNQVAPVAAAHAPRPADGPPLVWLLSGGAAGLLLFAAARRFVRRS